MHHIIAKLTQSPRQKNISLVLALLGVILPIPIAGIHKFYLGQYLWGIAYLLLWSTPVPRIASAIDAVWYLLQDEENFNFSYRASSLKENPSGPQMKIEHIQAATMALEKLEELRQKGLVSEMEFENKRRDLLERI
jgi:TM2 domain-containing membrane protein YozV